MKKILLFAWLSIYTLVSFAQSNSRNLKTELLVYFLPDSLELPDNKPVSVSSGQLKKAARSLDFGKLKVLRFDKAFPDWPDEHRTQSAKEGRPRFDRVFRLHFNSEAEANQAMSLLRQSPAILYAEKHTDAKLFNDPRFLNGEQWGLINDGRNDGIVDADIDADEAWQIYTGSPSIRLGVIDSGVGITHSEMAGKASGDGDDGSRHGTHVAGIAAANVNNGQGIRGVDWQARVNSYRIFAGADAIYEGDDVTAARIVAAVDGGCHVLNNSWGGGRYSSTLRQAFAYAYRQNRVVACAMGNNGDGSISYPAGFGQGIIAVGASTNRDVRAVYSQFGPHIDVVAPGGEANVVLQRSILSSVPVNGYEFMAGTSMATPHVSGVATLLKGYKSELYNDDIEQIIQRSADKV